MSAWRRIAIQAVPSLKREIEKSDNPDRLWIMLLEEFYFSVKSHDVEQARRIHQFALWCDGHSATDVYLTGAIWHFFLDLVEGYVRNFPTDRAVLPLLITPEQFNRWTNGVDRPHEQIEQARRDFAVDFRKLRHQSPTNPFG